jgi:CHAT domain-containing protein
MRKRWHGLKLLITLLLGLFISLDVSLLQESASVAQPPVQLATAQVAQSPKNAATLLKQNLQSFSQEDLSLAQQAQKGRDLYENGQFNEAIALWQQMAQTYATQQNPLATASTLSNLSLGYQQLGQWDNAQSAINESLSLIASPPELPSKAPGGANLETADSSFGRVQVMAQALMAQGSLKMALGQPRQALEIWQQAADTYQQSQDEMGHSRAQINQAQALRELGFYRQALEKLEQVADRMKTQPPSSLKAIALRWLGEALRLDGQLSASASALTESLAIAQQYANPTEVITTLLSLGHTTESQGDLSAAQALYQKAADTVAIGLGHSASQLVPIQLAQLALYIKTAQWPAATELWPLIQSQFEQLPPSRSTIYHQINWAESLLKMGPQMDLQAIDQQLRKAIAQARTLADTRSEAYAMGTLGQLYEQNQQWAIAQDLTQRALVLSKAIAATDILYQWQWQLGRLWQATDNPQQSTQKAIEAYYQAVDTLSQLRGDLTAANYSTQFSFKENVEPIYRQLAGLLLQTEPRSDQYQANLAKAQSVIESLRLAEIDNYFSEACIDAQTVDINRVDRKAAIVYTLVLDDRLSVILHLPDRPIQHFSTAVSRSEVSITAMQLRQQLVVRSHREYLPLAQQMYNWLIAPARASVDNEGIETLVFVLDGPLQNVPMAALYDGDRFLIEDYAVGLTLGLELMNPKPWKSDHLSALVTGISESHQGQGPLPYVEQEIQNISRSIRHTNKLFNRDFTREALSHRLKAIAYPIVHIATHSQFGSTPEETYLVAWDGLINVRDVNEMLQANLGNREGIELLVLSACETASSDQQAALGLAGVAIKAGASSTMGTLWAINDEATAHFIDCFYEQLTQAGATRAGTLRKAQLQLLQNPQYRHPFYWAPYVLLGSWL